MWYWYNNSYHVCSECVIVIMYTNYMHSIGAINVCPTTTKQFPPVKTSESVCREEQKRLFIQTIHVHFNPYFVPTNEVVITVAQG